MQEAAVRLPPTLEHVADELHDCFARGNKLLVCGNGGSASDSEHLVAELVGRYRDERRALAGAGALGGRHRHLDGGLQRLRLPDGLRPPGRGAGAGRGSVVRDQHQRQLT